MKTFEEPTITETEFKIKTEYSTQLSQHYIFTVMIKTDNKEIFPQSSLQPFNSLSLYIQKQKIVCNEKFTKQILLLNLMDISDV